MNTFDQQMHSNKNKAFTLMRQQANQKLRKKYVIDTDYYNSLLINYIIYNDKAHIVTIFKDYLILDDKSGFLKRYYTSEESGTRLPKYFEYYDSYSKLYPNYTVILEGKYLYHNIQKKQKMINIQEEMEYELKNPKKKNGFSDDVFSTDVYDSIINDRNNEDLDDIFNVHDKSVDNEKKLREIIKEIEQNDNLLLNNNLNHSGCNNIHQQAVLINSVSAKKKLMISSLLGRNKGMSNSSMYGSDYSNSTCYNKNSNNRISSSMNSHSQIPLTDRPSSSTKTTKTINNNNISKCNSVIKHIPSRQFSKTKIISNCTNVILSSSSNNISQMKNKTMKNDYGIPLTQRQNSKKKWNDSIFTKRKKKERKDKGEHDKITTPPKYTKNFIYIINQNPKFTTNLAFYDNSILRAESNKITTPPKSTNHKTNNNSNNGKVTISNAQTNVMPNQKTITCTKQKATQMDKQAPKTRNNSNNHLFNNFMLKTSRETQHKEQLNLLKTSSQLSITHKPKDYLYSIKYQSKRHSLKVKSTSRNKSSTNKTNNFTQRNDSISKKVSANISNTGSYIPKQKGIKGIQIHNFSKVFSLNFSQIISDRKTKNKKSNQQSPFSS